MSRQRGPKIRKGPTTEFHREDDRGLGNSEKNAFRPAETNETPIIAQHSAPKAGHGITLGKRLADSGL